MAKAIAALEKGMAGSFLQSKAAATLRRLAMTQAHFLDADRQELLSFLSNGEGESYVPRSGEVTGILKQMKEEMEKDLGAATEEENAAIEAYKALMAAKTKEVAALTKSIEEKLGRIGDLGVKIVEMKNDLTDTEEALIEDTKFLADLKENCATKTKEWDEIVKSRAAELVALAETIKILNDDDALDLFKKTLPSASLLQVGLRNAAVRERALVALLAARSVSVQLRPQLDFISMALRGKKIGFDKVIKMIDDMVATLKEEQKDDDNKREYCALQLDQADDKKKELEHTIADLENAIAADKEGIATLTAELKALEEGIKALDKTVVEATEQRKEEHEDFTELMAQDSAAKEIIGVAKNRLNKFYNPKLYKPPPKVELAEDERIVANMGGALLAQVASKHRTDKEAPPPPPEAFSAYSKKSEESTGVIAMLDLLVKDLDKEMTEAKAQEENAQTAYQKTMADAAEKRAQDSKSMTEKAAAKADTEGALQAKTESKTATGKELMATVDYIGSLHTECDWLLKYYRCAKRRAPPRSMLSGTRRRCSLAQTSRSCRHPCSGVGELPSPPSPRRSFPPRVHR